MLPFVLAGARRDPADQASYSEQFPYSDCCAFHSAVGVCPRDPGANGPCSNMLPHGQPLTHLEASVTVIKLIRSVVLLLYTESKLFQDWRPTQRQKVWNLCCHFQCLCCPDGLHGSCDYYDHTLWRDLGHQFLNTECVMVGRIAVVCMLTSLLGLLYAVHSQNYIQFLILYKLSDYRHSQTSSVYIV